MTDDGKDAWSQLLQNQFNFSFPFELMYYFASKEWKEAKSIIDIGCGEGHVLLELCNYFPEKYYTGIDSDNKKIERFIEKLDGQKDKKCHIQVQTKDYFKHKGAQYDVIMARLLVQHFEELGPFFKKAYSLLNDNGIIIFLETNDKARFFVPTIPSMNDFLSRFADRQKESGGNRMVSATIVSESEKHGFQLIDRQTIKFPSSLPTYKNLLFDTYMLIFDVVEHEYNLEFDYNNIRRELSEWYEMPYSYSQGAADLICVQKS